MSKDHLFEADCIAAEQELDRLYASNKELLAVLEGTLTLIRKAQERLSLHLQPDSHGNDVETMNELLNMFDGPEQRAVENNARAAIKRAKEAK